LDKLRQESNGNQDGYLTLKNSFNEIEKRCVKHQKSEIEVKKQLTVYKEFVVSIKLFFLYEHQFIHD
jgi:hypothetical protein